MNFFGGFISLWLRVIFLCGVFLLSSWLLFNGESYYYDSDCWSELESIMMGLLRADSFRCYWRMSS